MASVDDDVPRHRKCANPCCTYTMHSDPHVCDRFCCKRCESCFFTRPASESIYHGRYCEHRPAPPDMPRAPAAPSLWALGGENPWWQEVDESMSEVTAPMSDVDTPWVAASCSPVSPQPRIMQSPTPGSTSVALTRLAQGRSLYIVVRECENGWKWPYCILCRSWADSGHLLSRKHTHRMQWPEWYMENAETDLASTAFDTDSLEESSTLTVVRRGTLGPSSSSDGWGGEHSLSGSDVWPGVTGSWSYFKPSSARVPSSSAPTPPPPPSPLPRRSPLPPPAAPPSLRLPDTSGKMATAAMDTASGCGSSMEMARGGMEELFSTNEWSLLGDLQDFLLSEAGSCKSEP